MKKAKMIIALSIALMLTIMAGVGAGTYAYFTKTMTSSTNNIKVATFDPKMSFEDVSFDISDFHPDHDLIYQVDILNNNTKLATEYALSFDFSIPEEQEAANIFTNKNLKYYIYEGSYDEDKYIAAIAYNENANDWYIESNNTNQKISDLSFVKDASDNDTMDQIGFKFTPNDFEDHTILFKIKWPYDGGKDLDNDYLNGAGSFVLTCDAKQLNNDVGDPDTLDQLAIQSGGDSIILSYNKHVPETDVFITVNNSAPMQVTKSMILESNNPSFKIAYGVDKTIEVKVAEDILAKKLEAIYNH